MSALMPITRKQREALLRIYRRCPLYLTPDDRVTSQWTDSSVLTPEPLTFRQWRKRVEYGRDCLMVQWCGMWLGVEIDGYTHS